MTRVKDCTAAWHPWDRTGQPPYSRTEQRANGSWSSCHYTQKLYWKWGRGAGPSREGRHSPYQQFEFWIGWIFTKEIATSNWQIYFFFLPLTEMGTQGQNEITSRKWRKLNLFIKFIWAHLNRSMCNWTLLHEFITIHGDQCDRRHHMSEQRG